MARRRVNVRPGKGQSMVGFVVGILFCIFGLVMLPTFGLFGLVWTGIAVAITVQNYLNAFTDKGAPTHVIEVDEDELAEMGHVPSADRTADDIRTRLDAARQLYDSGAITREEYDRKREEILAQL